MFLFNSKRKNYFINPRFQLKYSGLLAGTGVVISVIMSSIIILFLNKALTIFAITGLSSIPSLMEILSEQLNNIVISLFFIFMILIIILILVGIYSSHKICGPIYVLERSLRNIIKGVYYEKMSLRKSDEFQELPTLFNRMIDKLSTKIQEDIAFLKLVETEIDNLSSLKDLPKDALETFGKIKIQAKILREQKSYSIK